MRNLLLVLALGAGLIGAFFWTSGSSPEVSTKSSAKDPSALRSSVPRERPTHPPQPGEDEPFSLPQPEPPPGLEARRAEAYREARARGDPRPAEAAFRKSVSHFIQHNRQFADAQAQAEGLTVAEVEELTAFGFMAQQTQRWPEVEEVMGEVLPSEIKEAAEALLEQTNAAFKRDMRALVDSGGTEEERWALIRQTQQAYREAYFATTGMNEAGLENLLAGDLARLYPPSQTPPPETLAQQQTELPEEPKPRPELAPDDAHSEPADSEDSTETGESPDPLPERSDD